MKKLEYKPAKWEKRKAILIENSKYDYDEVSSLTKLYNEQKIDKIRYHYTLSLCYKNIAEGTFVQNDYLACYKNIERSLNEFITSVGLLNEGKSTNQATAMNIENKISSGYFGYYALLTSNYDSVSQIVKSNSSILQMLSNNPIDEDANDMIRAMECAISKRNSDKFQDALVERIRKIRKFNLDNYICADFITMALIKEAKKVGMQFCSEYIEVDMKI